MDAHPVLEKKIFSIKLELHLAATEAEMEAFKSDKTTEEIVDWLVERQESVLVISQQPDPIGLLNPFDCRAYLDGR